jgi:hypothetical protein
VTELEVILRDRFGFDTEVAELDVSSKPQHQLDRHMSAFIEKNDGLHSLLIVFYSGHSRYNDLYGRLELCASVYASDMKGISQSAFVNWRRAEDMLCSDEVDGDVLVVLDATYTDAMFESLKANTHVRSTKRLYELISSCPPDQRKDPSDIKAFTRAFNDTLIDLVKTRGSRPFSTTQINQRIRMVSRGKSTPSQLWSLFDNERHITLSPMKGKDFTQQQIPWPLAPARSYLKLGLAFRDSGLNEEQIELLILGLNNALMDRRVLGLRKIDWLGIEIRPAVQQEQTGWARTAVARWKRVVQKKREEREGAKLNPMIA